MYIILFFILDQVAKCIVKSKLQPVSFVKFIKGFISFEYVENRGAAFGIMNGKQIFLIVITSLFVLGLMYYYLTTRKKNKKVLNIGLEIVIAGALGNLVDRIFRGYVVDFIKFEFFDFPVFNIADVCIDVGVLLIILCVIFTKENNEDKKEKHK